MITSTILMPAYGRQYASFDAALIDWNKGLDFKETGCGSYCSIRDSKTLAYLCTVYLYLPNLGKSVILIPSNIG